MVVLSLLFRFRFIFPLLFLFSPYFFLFFCSSPLLFLFFVLISIISAVCRRSSFFVLFVSFPSPLFRVVLVSFAFACLFGVWCLVRVHSSVLLDVETRLNLTSFIRIQLTSFISFRDTSCRFSLFFDAFLFFGCGPTRCLGCKSCKDLVFPV